MRNYEVVVIFRSDLDETTITGLVEKIAGWISSSGGSVSKTDVWGKRRMAYAIRKQIEGYYVLLHANMAASFTTELERNLRLTEAVLRFMVTAEK
jgi:small subunit ribosomal protein S6